MPEALDGAVFVVADGEGEVSLFHGPTLSVFPLSRYGEVGESVELEPLPDQSSPGYVLEAVLSPSGRRWLVRFFGGSRRLRYFVRGEEVVLPETPWRVASIGFAGETPVAVVSPSVPGHSLTGGPAGKPPLLVRYDGSKWISWVQPEEPLSLDEFRRVPPNRRYDLRLVSTDDGHLWLVPRYSYRLQELSSSGRRLTRLAVGEEAFQHQELSGEEIATRIAELDAAADRGVHVPDVAREMIRKKTSEVRLQLHAAAEGRDGKLYLLTGETDGEDGRPMLHRYDSVLATLEGTPLAVDPYSGIRTMVAGERGLVIANYKAGTGLWVVPWEALRTADWREVEEVRVGSGGAE